MILRGRAAIAKETSILTFRTRSRLCNFTHLSLIPPCSVFYRLFTRLLQVALWQLYWPTLCLRWRIIREKLDLFCNNNLFLQKSLPWLNFSFVSIFPSIFDAEFAANIEKMSVLKGGMLWESLYRYYHANKNKLLKKNNCFRSEILLNGKFPRRATRVMVG